MSFFTRAEWRLHKEFNKLRLKNKNPTIISSNCNGGFIAHDLGLRFNSPTVNLFFTAADFIRFASNPEYYLSAEPEEIHSIFDFPVGKIHDVTLYFMHYRTFAEAREKWLERSKRVDFDNCFIIMTDKNDCTYENILAFDSLPYKNKVIFTHRPYPEIASAYYMPGFEDKGEVGILSDFKPGLFRRRWLDGFDYVRFLNGKGFKKKCQK